MLSMPSHDIPLNLIRKALVERMTDGQVYLDTAIRLNEAGVPINRIDAVLDQYRHFAD